jgi:hypothetical protein
VKRVSDGKIPTPWVSLHVLASTSRNWALGAWAGELCPLVHFSLEPGCHSAPPLFALAGILDSTIKKVSMKSRHLLEDGTLRQHDMHPSEETRNDAK